MKKITLVLASLLTLLPLGSKADPGDVIFLEFSKEADPQEIPRSSTPEIEGCYLVSAGLLELFFNVYVGEVDVEITDEYSNVVETSNLSSTPGSLFVPIVVGSGTYSVYIETSSGDGYTGRFIL